MALGTEHDFSIHRGDDRTITFTVVDDVDAVVDITGASLAWVLSKQDPNFTTPEPLGAALVTKSVGSGVTIVDGPSGTGEVALLSADTLARLPGDYYQELQIQLSGKTTTIMFGIIEVKKDIVAPGP